VATLVPWPLPRGWVLGGVGTAGDEVTGIGAVVVALTGPNPLGGPAELLVVTEEPGTGLGARLAGLPGPDPGVPLVDAPYVRLEAEGRTAPLWIAPADDGVAAFVGELDGGWLWVLLRPVSAGVLLLEPDLGLADVRTLGDEVDLLPYGARSTWLDPDTS
jgi:hypothetical protein